MFGGEFYNFPVLVRSLKLRGRGSNLMGTDRSSVAVGAVGL